MQQANSGHPGIPLALAPAVYTIWNRVMCFDPEGPILRNRDRFVLSNDYASMLLWALLFLIGTRAGNADYERLGEPAVSLDDIRRFRQLDSKAAGHPEHHWTSGVETTTGPLGQGVATSVSMAIAQKWLASLDNRPGAAVFNHCIVAVCGDGCVMEGAASEAASLAGHLGLDDLCWRYDNSHITIEGSTRIIFTEYVAARSSATAGVCCASARPTMSTVSSTRSTCSAKRRTGPLLSSSTAISVMARRTNRIPRPPMASRSVRRKSGWPSAFMADLRMRSSWCLTACARISRPEIGARGAEARRRWTEMFQGYQLEHPELAAEIEQTQRREPPSGWDRDLPVIPSDAKGPAGREASGEMLNVIAQSVPWFLGGSADPGPSNKTTLKFPGAGDFQAASPGGKNLHLGIRQHAMAAMVNGLTKLRSFFVLSDYARPDIRLSALMELPASFIFTRHAMGDGEDGPTHQPVEQLLSLRDIPGLVTLRPADANEVVEAYRCIMGLRHQPAVLVLSRQPLNRGRYASASGIARGAYVLADAPGGKPDVILIASGSEVSLAIDAHEILGQRPPSRGDGPRSGRAGVHPRLGPLCRREGQSRRHARLWRVGAAQEIAGDVRVRAGARFGSKGSAPRAAMQGHLERKTGAPRCITGNRSRLRGKFRGPTTWRPL